VTATSMITANQKTVETIAVVKLWGGGGRGRDVGKNTRALKLL
jgi:hypothetical protein